MCVQHTLKVIDEAERKNTKSPPVPTHLSRETLICPDLVPLHGSIRSSLTETQCLVQSLLCLFSQHHFPEIRLQNQDYHCV